MTDVHWNFTYPCHTCGATVHVAEGKSEPHTCRVHLSPETEEKP